MIKKIAFISFRTKDIQADKHFWGELLGLKLAKIPVSTEPIGRWRTDEGVHYYSFFEPAMRRYGYEFPE